MIQQIAVRVMGNRTADKIQFAVADLTKRLFQTRLTFTQTLHLRTHQGNPCFQFFQQMIIKPRLLIGYRRAVCAAAFFVALGFLTHNYLSVLVL